MGHHPCCCVADIDSCFCNISNTTLYATLSCSSKPELDGQVVALTYRPCGGADMPLISAYSVTEWWGARLVTANYTIDIYYYCNLPGGSNAYGFAIRTNAGTDLCDTTLSGAAFTAGSTTCPPFSATVTFVNFFLFGASGLTITLSL